MEFGLDSAVSKGGKGRDKDGGAVEGELGEHGEFCVGVSSCGLRGCVGWLSAHLCMFIFYLYLYLYLFSCFDCFYSVENEPVSLYLFAGWCGLEVRLMLIVGIRTGDIVLVSEQPAGSAKKREVKDLEAKGSRGVVTRVAKTGICKFCFCGANDLSLFKI